MLQAYLPDALAAMIRPAGLGRRAPRRRRRRRSRCAWSRAPTCRWSGSRPRCTAGRWPPGTPSRTPTPTTSASSTARCTRSRIAQRAHRRRRPQPLRHRLRLAAGQAARRRAPASSSRCCSAWRTGQAEAVRKDVGAPAALHAGGAPGRVRRRDRLPDPPARGGRQPGELHVRRLRTRATNAALFEREKQRFLASLAELDDAVPAPQPHAGPQPAAGRAARRPRTRFDEHPGHRPVAAGQPRLGPRRSSTRVADLDARQRRPSRPPRSTTPSSPRTRSSTTAVEAGKAWGALAGAERAAILHRAGDVLEARRADLLEVMAAETGKTIDQGDPEVSEAVDFAHYYAESRPRAGRRRRRHVRPGEADRGDPAVELPGRHPGRLHARGPRRRLRRRHQARQQARRCGAVHGRGALGGRRARATCCTWSQLGERELGQQLISHPAVDRVILTGGYETAELFRSFRPDLPLLAETSGKNAIIVTPSADLDLAAKDVVVLRLRPRRPEVLRRVAGDPGRLGRDVRAVPQPAGRRRHAR